MTIMIVMDRTLPLAVVKAHLSEIVDRVSTDHERVILTRNGRPAAILMSPEDLEALEETLDVLSDPDALRDIATALADVEEGRYVGEEELRTRFRTA
jgi:prevent-host-death family protein